jgi:formiminotetrahydrofolate cyclodeaminase
MSDLLDIANYVRLKDAETKANNSEEIRGLNDQARELSDRYGMHVDSYDRFARQNPMPEPRGFWGRLGSYLGTAAIVAGVVVGLAALGGVLTAALVVQVGLLTAGATAAYAFFDDEKPELVREHLDKYRNYLDRTSEKLENAVAQGMIQEKQPGASMSIDQQIALQSQQDKGPTYHRDRLQAAMNPALQNAGRVK